MFCFCLYVFYIYIDYFYSYFLVFTALKALSDACLAKKSPILGMKPLIEAITWITDGHPEHLTPAHASFLCLCLKARHFYLCEPFIKVDMEAILVQVSLYINITNDCLFSGP